MWRNASALEVAQSLGLADGFPAGGPHLGYLPEEGPKDQAQVPTTIAGVGAIVFLRQEMARDEGLKEQFELMKSRTGGGAKTSKFMPELVRPRRKVRSFVHGQRLYCPVDRPAILFL